MDMNVASFLFGSPVMPSTRRFRHVPGLRVLVVDDDLASLRILEKMLMECLYEVTKCNRAEIALNLLRDNPEGFDIVISEAHLPDMDGFQLLKKVGLEMDLPLILTSADGMEMVKIGMTYGACNYLIKPVSIEALRSISQHVRIKVDDDDESVLNKPTKPRVLWTIDLHQKFVAAVNQLGIEKATPKKILDLMNEPGLTRNNVASHFQKYRLYLKRLINDDCSHQALGSTQLLPMHSQGTLLQQPRVGNWSVELHQKFVSAVNQLGIDKATPEKIPDLMNVPAPTQENIARHLVIYRAHIQQARIHRALNAQSHGGIGVPVDPFTLPGSSKSSLLQPSNGNHIIGNEVSQPSLVADISPNIKTAEKDDKHVKDDWIVELDNVVGSSTKRSLFQLGFSSGQNYHTVLMFFGMMCVVFWVWFVFPNLLNCSF